MYSVNDTILYGSQLCRIVEMAKRKDSGKVMEYYVLKPIYSNSSTIFVPVTSEKLTSKMRRILSAPEIHSLIKGMPDDDTIWIENETERKERYREILTSGDRTSLVGMIKALYTHQKERQDLGRKLHVSDERFLKEAERTLYDEFALVLNIRQDQVLPFILEQLEVDEMTMTDNN